MDFEYCEKCGKRVPSDKIDRGAGGYVGVDYYCENCLPASANTRVSKPASRNRRSAAQSERRGESQKPSRQSRAASRYSTARSHAGEDYQDSPRRSSRSSEGSRSRRSESRSERPDRSGRSGRSDRRDSYRDSGRGRDGRNGRDSYDDGRKKKIIIIASIAGAILILFLALGLGGAFSSKKPVATTFKPTPTPVEMNAYSAKLRTAYQYLEEAKGMYVKGKAKASAHDQSAGIQKAIDHLQKAIDLIQPIADRYDDTNKKVPKDIDAFLEEAYKAMYGYNKSKPMD